MKRLLICLALLGIAAAFVGCASMDPYSESSIPWNAPQPWEGSPGIPGLEGR